MGNDCEYVLLKLHPKIGRKKKLLNENLDNYKKFLYLLEWLALMQNKEAPLPK
jgi:hypothetical protein